MLATLGTAADIDEELDEWSLEMKWDGIRAIASVRAGRVDLHTRNGNDVTASYPELAVLPERVTGDVVLDGEIVALDKRGRPSFGLLQQRMGLTKKPEVDAAAAQVPVHYFVFDILNRRDRSLEREPYDRRRSELLRAVRPAGAVQVPDAFDGDLQAAMSSSHELGLEGVVAKKRDGIYREGARSRSWIKLKHHATQEVVIGGWRPGSGRRAGVVGSLLLGIPGEGGLTYVGRVGTGFTESELVEVTASLGRIKRATSPFVDVPHDVARDANWVSPTLVGEVEFAEWTSASHLRQPSWRGWRPDKAVDEVVREPQNLVLLEPAVKRENQ
jgi:bifunctional non-homologous end joining protein LigD